ncbi:NERD domain-containing protein [Bacillus infantis]|uniref:NERD domain-containing protein n=1 Tax=Bacillus infantis TaxID=324767 RepID=A0A5D4SI35_9BACI|nr:nuclease-related domain-containing protein [Bacillus infantis]TYS62361.1 NERD domain-containing protein [Bacillus infantis]
MILKKIELPLKLQKLQALHRQLPQSHPKYQLIQEKLAKGLAGYRGELSVEYQLGFLPEDKYLIFHDIRLQEKEHFFQMDFLLLSKEFIVTIEVKNMAGTLYFDPVFQQLIRTQNEKEEAFPDPLIQIQRHKSLMASWLRKQNYPPIPIESLIVISSPYTLLKTSPKNESISKIILHSEALSAKIKKLELNQRESCLDDKQWKKLSRLILKKHTPLNADILEQYDIRKAELITGVFCPSCQALPMGRSHGTWLCPQCHFKAADCHLPALDDYRLLIGPAITNGEARHFLQVSSLQLAGRLLHHVQPDGKTKGRIYILK